MDHRIAALFMAVSACSLGQTPIACASRLIPLKPTSLLCSNAAPVCVADQTGMNGRWVWGCPTQPPVQANPSIPLSVTQPHIMMTIDIAIEAEKLRQLRLQNQQLEQQLREAQTETPPPALAESSSDVPSPDGTNWRIMAPFEKSMVLWNSMKPHDKNDKSIIKALDKFYADPANLKVPIIDAAVKVSLPH